MKSKTTEELAQQYCYELPEEVQKDPKQLFLAYNSFIAGYNIWGVVKIKSKSQSSLYGQVIDIVCNYFNTTFEEVNIKSREENIVKVRQISMYLGKEYTKLPLSELSRLWNKTHATVLHSHKRISNLIETEPEIDNDIYNIIKAVKRLLTLYKQ